MKTCTKCLQSKDNSLFYYNRTICKQCQIDYAKSYKKSHQEQVKLSRKRYNEKHHEAIKHYQREIYLPRHKIQKNEYDKEYYKNNTGTFTRRFWKWHYNALKRNIVWDLTKEYLESLEKRCYYTGIELTLESNKSNTISLDRLDSSKGYTKDNVVFCCADLNLMKQSFSVDKFLNLCESVASYKKRTLEDFSKGS